MLTSAMALVVAAATAPAPSGDAVVRLGQAFDAYRAGDYARAERLADGLPERLVRTRDYALLVAAESAFYSASPARARPRFESLAREKRSRFASSAAFRVADCLWAEGRRAEAVARYKTLLRGTPTGVDTAVARFHIAELAPAAEARKLFRAVYVDFPAHPLAAEADRRASAIAAPAASTAAPAPTAATPADRLRRASTLSAAREWQAALDELALLPATATPEFPSEMMAERDLVWGMTKYHMRRDYARAGEVLLGAVDRLAQVSADKASSAAFHGARALSRADRDDEAITHYLRVVQRFPQSRWTAEAQFRAGWLDFNRGRFAEGLPRLMETVKRFPRSEWATDAAWYVAFGHYLLGDAARALAGLDEFEQRARGPGGKGGIDALGRVAYFRARALGRTGRADDEKRALVELAQRNPFAYYGMLARARLGVLGTSVTLDLPKSALTEAKPGTRAARDPALARADELATAGMTIEAGVELGRDEKAVLDRLGSAEGLAVLFDRYPRMMNFRRAYQLAEARGSEALRSAPEGPARVYWQAAYPLAFRDLVDRFGPPAANPEHFLFAIMRKESGFSPHDVSYADARGLLQMIPPTSARVARLFDLPFEPDELYDPETNIHLGAVYIGSLVRKFKGQPLLAAGAYNAGPRAMMRWCDQHGKRPLDELVELVTYEQTREYIKRVAAIYGRYRYLYAGEVLTPSLGVDCRYEKSGPDY